MTHMDVSVKRTVFWNDESGYVDSMGIMHKGTAKNKVVEID